MDDICSLNDADPLEGSSYNVDVTVKSEIKHENDEEDGYNTMALLELATCVETYQEPIEFGPTEAVFCPKTGMMACLLCLAVVSCNLLGDHMCHAHRARRVHTRCAVCCAVFRDRDQLLIHRKECRPHAKRHKRKSFQQLVKEAADAEAGSAEPAACGVCSLRLPRGRLAQHLLQHAAPGAAPQCATCRRRFKTRLTLREHVRLVHHCREETEECELCGQKFRSQKYLSNHRRNVHPQGGQVHECGVCGKSFKSRLCLHQHGKYVHPPPAAAAACPLCPHKTFKSKINLHQHLRVSHGIYRKDAN